VNRKHPRGRAFPRQRNGTAALQFVSEVQRSFGRTPYPEHPSLHPSNDLVPEGFLGYAQFIEKELPFVFDDLQEVVPSYSILEEQAFSSMREKCATVSGRR
jgi:hypothetical protein